VTNLEKYRILMNYLLSGEVKWFYHFLQTQDFKGFDWNITSNEHRNKTLLFAAASEGFLEVVKDLYARGSKIDVKNGSGSTALSIAVEYGYLEIARFLLEKGADINTVNSRNITPIYKAVNLGISPMVELLIKYKPNLNIKSNGEYNGETPLDCANRNGYSGIKNMLLKYMESK